ncbi:MAG TPA: hypothetical protein VMT63_12495 [Bacteroidales bacterium]|nr:hypothetical protein [Bacteroidales bacterium]
MISLFKGRNSIYLPVLLLCILSSCKESPVSIYSENPHYFYFRRKPIILITSDHHYGAVIDRDFDFKKYLCYLSSSGMNLTRIYPGGMFELPDKYIEGSPLGPKRGRQILPWAKSDVKGADSLLAEAGKPSFKFDLDRWNPEYFARLRSFVKEAAKRGIVVEVPFFNGMYEDCWPLTAFYHGNNIQNVGKYEPGDCGFFTSSLPQNSDVLLYQEAYVKKITQELNEFNNVIFDICDEPSLQGLPGGGCKFLPDSQVVPWITRLKDVFTETESILPKKHLLGQTVQNLSPDFSDQTWCQWLPTEYAGPAAKALDKDYRYNKPVVDVESNFYGISLTKNPYNTDAVRLEGWWFMTGGGAGCINLNGEYHAGQENGGKDTRTIIVPQKKILKKFMESFDLSRLSKSSGVEGPGGNVIFNLLSEKGKQYALYAFHGAFESEWGSHFTPFRGEYSDSLIIKEVPPGIYSGKWMDPGTGAIIESREIAWSGGDMILRTPEYNLDIALSILKKK